MLDREKYAEKRYFDEKHIPEDIWLVLRATSLLGISEFELFTIAWHEWYGGETSEDVIEKFFIPYMFNDQVPPWVRHFAQNILTLDSQGCLDPGAFGINSQPHSPEAARRGWLYMILLAAISAALIIMTKVMVESLGVVSCLFPPCY